MKKRSSLLLAAFAALVVTACGQQDEAPAAMAAPEPAMEAMADGDFREMKKEAAGGSGYGAPGAPPPPPSASPKRKASRARAEPEADKVALNMEMADEEAPADDAAPGEAGGEAAPTRSWFPETLLFAPEVVTDSSGRAAVPVTVPDQLTSWRVLALAHTKTGEQSGTEASFVSTLPTYVDVVAPPTLLIGDRVKVPVQVVNTTDEEKSGELVVIVEGTKLVAAPKKVKVPAQRSTVESVEIAAERPGPASIKVGFSDQDTVLKTFEVRTAGRPGSVERGGTLAAARKLTLTFPEDTERGSARLRLTAFPGALALLRAELAAAPSRSATADVAYLLGLAGQAAELSERLGARIEADEEKRLRSIAVQRALRFTRRPSAPSAMMFAPAALAHEGQPLLERLGARLADQVARAQRPDGTFLGGDGWKLQRLVVATAAGVRALSASAVGEKGPRRAEVARVRGATALARMLPQVKDPYSAAAALASGAVEGKLKDELTKRVRSALKKRGDGGRVLPVPKGAVRADGSRPTEMEATALAVLALSGDASAKAERADLGAALLSAYRPGRGFGDGQTNLIALEAVMAIFDQPLPKRVVLTTLLDGEPFVQGVLEGTKLKDTTVLTGGLEEAAGTHTLEIKSEPPVPGLAFVLSQRWTEPYDEPDEDAGLGLTEERPKQVRVGQPFGVTLSAAAPGGQALVIRYALPAGMLADEPLLERLVREGLLERYSLEEGVVELVAPRRGQGQAFRAPLRFTPTLAGTLNAKVSSVALKSRGGSEVYVPTKPWTVK
jgi:hypothetical protein